MTLRRPHLSRLLPTVLATLALSSCSSATDTVATDGATDSPSSSTEQVTDRSTTDPALPDDLPLDTGLVRRWSDMPVQGPGRAVPGITVTEVCEPDPTVWPGPALDRLAAEQTGPEYRTVREAVLYETPADARATLGRLEAQVQACPTWGDQSYTMLEGSGRDGLVFGMHHRSSLGGTVWLVTRHDDVLVALSSSGEASQESLEPMAEQLARTHDEVWAAIGPALG